MGLASSQARILLLTARKSDLEYRAQAISQRKMNIAMQTQQLATDYSTAMSNRRMKFIYYADGQSGKTFEEDLSYAGLMSENAQSAGDFLIKTTSGRYLVTGDTKAKNNNGYTEYEENLYKVAKKLAEADGSIKKYYVTQKDANGNDQTYINRGALMAAYVNQTEYVAGASNNSFFQSALRNGSFYLYQATNQQEVEQKDGSKVTTCDYECVSWSGLSSINDAYDTSDDAAAEADYEAKSLVLSNQDKMLDLELQQIETQHKAIETEYDSVKKVIENNIKVSFKIFS